MKNALLNCPICDSDNIDLMVIDARKNWFNCKDCQAYGSFRSLAEVTR